MFKFTNNGFGSGVLTKIMILNCLFFNLNNKATIDPNSIIDLDQLARFIKENPIKFDHSGLLTNLEPKYILLYLKTHRHEVEDIFKTLTEESFSQVLRTGTGEVSTSIDSVSSAARDAMKKLSIQASESLKRDIGPGIEELGTSVGNAMAPARNQILKGIGCGVAILVSGALIKHYGTKYINKHMLEPKLIEKKSRSGFVREFFNLFRSKSKLDLSKHMIISDDLKNELELVMAMTSNVKKHGGHFENIMLSGAPGTGKTLFAQLLAEQCGMDYAIIPAANVSQFLNSGKAVEELNNLFDWAAKSKRGTILFFDETENFLADRSTLSSAAQDALAIFLAKTGTPSDKIMIIGTTNRPEVIDKAVSSRFGIHINFPLPDEQARYDQLIMHIKNVFEKQQGSSVAYDYLQDEYNLKILAKETEDWSGRTLQKFVNRLRQQSLALDQLDITEETVEQVLKQIQNNPQFN